MKNITNTRLRESLAALGDLLEVDGADPVHLIVVGGSGLLAIGVIERATRDVDVVALEREGRLVSAEPLPKSVAAAAAVVARDFGLESHWLNAGPTGLLEIGGLPDGFSSRLSEHSFGSVLRVSYAARKDQVHFKLYAAVNRTEARDDADLRALAPTEAELRAAARWVRTHHAPGPVDDEIVRVLADFGVEDDGRDA